MDKRTEFLKNIDNWDKIPSYKVYFRKASERTFAIWAESSEVPSSLDVNNTYKYMCRHHFNCLELGTRRKKRLGLVGMLGYTTAKKSHMSDSKKRKAPGSQTERKKRRTVAFTCSAPIPKIRGRKQLPCRICGYAIPKSKSSVTMSCCNLSAHSLCWLNATESYREKNGPPNRPQCCMITSYRAKGGAELPDSAQLSASQRLASPPRPSTPKGATRTQPDRVSTPHDVTEKAPCPFCGQMLSLNDNRHALSECTRLDQLFDPGGLIGSVGLNTLTPLATRCAAMSRVDSMEGTPLSKRAPFRR